MLRTYYQNPANYIRYSHSRELLSNTEFHLHNQFEIYFFISGNVNYFVEKKVYHLEYGDLLVMNSHEIHRPSFQSSDMYERIVVHFEPNLISQFNSPGFDLLNCFINRPKGEQNKFNLTITQKEEVLRYLHQIENITKHPSAGTELLILTCLIELLVYLNRVFMSILVIDEHPNLPENLVPILDHIENNLPDDLSLETLAKRFFINRYYLSRLFKKTIGSNLHEYIVFKRISLAKKLLAEGCNVTDACQLSGFDDYSNFIRTFKRTVGVAPGYYKKQNFHP